MRTMTSVTREGKGELHERVLHRATLGQTFFKGREYELVSAFCARYVACARLWARLQICSVIRIGVNFAL